MDHSGYDGFGDLDGGVDVNLEDIVDFVVGGFDEVYWVGMGSADVVDYETGMVWPLVVCPKRILEKREALTENANIKVLDLGLETRPLNWVV